MGNIDELIQKYKQEAEQLSITPSPHVWKNVNKEIKSGRSATRLFLNFFLLACALVAGLFAVRFCFKEKPVDKRNVQVPVNVAKDETVTIVQPDTITKTVQPLVTPKQKKDSPVSRTAARQKKKDADEDEWDDLLTGALYHRSWQFRMLPDSTVKMPKAVGDSTTEKPAAEPDPQLQKPASATPQEK